MLPETIRFADRPLEPKEVDGFPVIVMLSTGDDGEPNSVWCPVTIVNTSRQGLRELNITARVRPYT